MGKRAGESESGGERGQMGENAGDIGRQIRSERGSGREGKRERAAEGNRERAREG